MASSPLPHVAIFPFLSKGHAMPLLQLARLLHRCRLASALTFFTTPRNAPFVRAGLAGTDAAVVELPLPSSDAPQSTDELPSMSLFLDFMSTVSALQPAFAAALCLLDPRPDVLVVDAFLPWTKDVADEHGVPRLVSYGFGAFPMYVSMLITMHKPHAHVRSPSEPFAVPGLPGLRLTKDDLSPPIDEPEPTGLLWDFMLEARRSAHSSRGIIANSFYELEQVYVDGWNRDQLGAKVWPIGPLCLARKPGRVIDPTISEWLDSRLAMNRPVLYVAFGTQAELTQEQVEEIATGLDRSGLDFLWVIRSIHFKPENQFEERFGDRGKVVGSFVDQLSVLGHKSVTGFLTHCGWNSLLESISMGVPLLALPLANDQQLNAKFVVDVIRVGLRLWPSDGARGGLVIGKDVEIMARELIHGEEGKRVAERACELAASARKAMDDGGSSFVNLEMMLHDVCEMGTAKSNGE